jgi:hypothetical protein
MKNNINYIVCYSKDDSEWFENIVELMNDYNKRVEFSNKTKEIIKNSYNWEFITNDFFNKTML